MVDGDHLEPVRTADESGGLSVRQIGDSSPVVGKGGVGLVVDKGPKLPRKRGRRLGYSGDEEPIARLSGLVGASVRRPKVGQGGVTPIRRSFLEQNVGADGQT